MNQFKPGDVIYCFSFGYVNLTYGCSYVVGPRGTFNSLGPFVRREIYVHIMKDEYGNETEALATDFVPHNPVLALGLSGAALAPPVLYPANLFGISAAQYPAWMQPTPVDQLGAVPRVGAKKHAHSWKTYVGLTDTFDFCEVCDEKRRA